MSVRRIGQISNKNLKCVGAREQISAMWIMDWLDEYKAFLSPANTGSYGDVEVIWECSGDELFMFLSYTIPDVDYYDMVTYGNKQYLNIYMNFAKEKNEYACPDNIKFSRNYRIGESKYTIRDFLNCFNYNGVKQNVRLKYETEGFTINGYIHSYSVAIHRYGRKASCQSFIETLNVTDTNTLVNIARVCRDMSVEQIDYELRKKSIIYKDELIANKNLTTLVIPSTIREIERYALENQKNLKILIIEANQQLKRLQSTCTMNDSLEEVVIGEGVTELFSTFCDCKELRRVVLPHSLQMIYEAFCDCKNLESIYIPENVTEIKNAFMGCDRLKNVTIDDNNLQYTVYGGMIYSKDYKTVCQCIGGSEYLEFHPNTEIIAPYAFNDTSNNLRCNIVLPPTVKKVGSFAFTRCSRHVDKSRLSPNVIFE